MIEENSRITHQDSSLITHHANISVLDTRPFNLDLLLAYRKPTMTTMILSQATRRISRTTYLYERSPASRLFSTKRKEEGGLHVVRAGLPLILFCGLGAWVVASGIEGKNKERDAFQGRISKYVSRSCGHV
jgi:hypothetical protein